MAQGVPPGPRAGLGQGLLLLLLLLILLHPRTVSQASSSPSPSPSTSWPPATGEHLENIWILLALAAGGEPAWEGAIFIKLPRRGQWGPAPRGAGLGGGQDAAQPRGSCRIPGEQRPARSPAGTSALVRPQGAGSRRAVPEKTRLILVGPGRELARGGAETVPVSRAPKAPDSPRWALVHVQQHHVCGAGAHGSHGRYSPALPHGVKPSPDPG